jgi:mannose-1-phosphate guanylyltransferase/mannose-6-phosphate isomerase
MTAFEPVSTFDTPYSPQPRAWNRHAWGASQSLTEQDRFKVRHLILRPGQAIGLQSHYHRSEHWVIVQGSARVTIGNETRDVFENGSLDIAIGLAHRLENHGKVDLHLIEVQTGAYLGDDDITRPDDGLAA